MTVTGTVKRVAMGTGTWSIESDDGTTYEIYQGAPSELLQDGLKVKVDGVVRDNVMTFAAIGPVLEVRSMEIL
ncbi:MAG: hypothetical protein J7641_06035 [Cyanobacteria bacterium SID2]|nr:hypothetical protein [Cyanobacteria bacterium SID2]MBP0006743.1 hypothetical protein [Cyanobacteria bacterium SBC]